MKNFPRFSLESVYLRTVVETLAATLKDKPKMPSDLQDISLQDEVAPAVGFRTHYGTTVVPDLEQQNAILETLRTLRVLRENSSTSITDMAHDLTNLSVALLDLGIYDGALETYSHVVLIYRKCVKKRPKRFGGNLALALIGVSVSSKRLGEEASAVATIQEAVEILRNLVEDDVQHHFDLALALNNAANCLKDVGLHRDALSAAQEGLTIRRQAVADQDSPPDEAHRADLAVSLLTTSSCLSKAGFSYQAWKTTKEAVNINRTLAAEHPHLFEPHLAASLHNSSHRLAELGRYEEAVEAIVEAASIRSVLSNRRPEVYNPGYVRSLVVASNLLKTVKHSAMPVVTDEALDKLQVLECELHHLYRQPSTTSSTSPSPGGLTEEERVKGDNGPKRGFVDTSRRPQLDSVVAASYFRSAKNLSRLGQNDDALVAWYRLLNMYLSVVHEKAGIAFQSFSPHLALFLTLPAEIRKHFVTGHSMDSEGIGKLDAVAGWWKDVVVVDREWTAIAKASWLSYLGQYEEAVMSASGSLRIYRSLMTDRQSQSQCSPAFACTLTLVSCCHHKLGQIELALGAAREAVYLWRDIVDDRVEYCLNDNFEDGLHDLNGSRRRGSIALPSEMGGLSTAIYGIGLRDQCQSECTMRAFAESIASDTDNVDENGPSHDQYPLLLSKEPKPSVTVNIRRTSISDIVQHYEAIGGIKRASGTGTGPLPFAEKPINLKVDTQAWENGRHSRGQGDSPEAPRGNEGADSPLPVPDDFFTRFGEPSETRIVTSPTRPRTSTGLHSTVDGISTIYGIGIRDQHHSEACTVTALAEPISPDTDDVDKNSRYQHPLVSAELSPPEEPTPRVNIRRTSISDMVQRYEAIGKMTKVGPPPVPPKPITLKVATQITENKQYSKGRGGSPEVSRGDGGVGSPLPVPARGDFSTRCGESSSSKMRISPTTSSGSRTSPCLTRTSTHLLRTSLVSPLDGEQLSEVDNRAPRLLRSEPSGIGFLSQKLTTATDDCSRPGDERPPSPELPYRGVANLIDQWQRKTAEINSSGSNPTVARRRSGVVAKDSE